MSNYKVTGIIYIMGGRGGNERERERSYQIKDSLVSRPYQSFFLSLQAL